MTKITQAEYGRIHTDGSRSGGQPPRSKEPTMNETKRLSLHGRLRMEAALPGYNASLLAEAADAIERHEAFAQEVSDAAQEYDDHGSPMAWTGFDRFIIAKPDPLVEALTELHWAYDDNGCEMADELRKAIEARGGKIVWGKP